MKGHHKNQAKEARAQPVGSLELELGIEVTALHEQRPGNGSLPCDIHPLGTVDFSLFTCVCVQLR